ncbi:MAG: MCE family protein [Bacteroidales bacterium]|nr:MCE family protein [Bacteroidales bacterium]
MDILPVSLGNKRISLIISIIIVIIIVTIIMVRFLSATKTYYAVFENVKGLSVDDPVIIEGLKVGNVKMIDFLLDGSNNLIVKIKMKSDINIPDKSYTEILPLKHPEFDKSLNIKFVSSDGYFEDGDTIKLKKTLVTVDSLIELSNRAKQELVETMKTEVENQQELKQIQQKEEVKQEEVVKKEKVVKQEEPKIPVKENVTTNDKVVFKLQILVSKEKIPLTDKRFKKIENINFYEDNGLYKYVLGDEKSFDKIKELSQQVKKNTFPDAFIVAFRNDKRISVKEAKRLLEK